MVVRGALIQIGRHQVERARWDWAEVERNPFFCPDAKLATTLEAYLDGVRSVLQRAVIVHHDAIDPYAYPQRGTGAAIACGVIKAQ